MKRVSKKVISLFLAFFMMLSVLPFAGLAENTVFSITANATTSVDFRYRIFDNNVEITGYYGDPDIVVIPSEIEGIPVTSIGSSAFQSCSSLTSITIPDSVTSIGGEAFAGCQSLTNITVDTGNNVYDSRENCNAIIETASNTLITGCKSTIIPSSVTSIGDAAFLDCDNLTSITIPDSVTSIGYWAFAICDSLTSITIPDSVTSIGGEAFASCWRLTSITIPDSVTSIGCEAFDGCQGLTNITVDTGNNVYDSRENCNAIIETASNTLIAGCKSTIIPSSVTSIGDRAFATCDSLTSITIPDSVTSIGDGAFESCRNLTSITIPDSVTSIGDWAFAFCDSLTSITIPDSVTSIGDSAFAFCASLTSITIPDSVTSIGAYAFDGCYNLTSITVDTGNPVYDSRDNCNAIIETASNTLIEGCKSTIIPSSVTSIGDLAFAYCFMLTSITIPDSVTSIGDGAFAYCDSLETVYYAGTEEEWNDITIGEYNERLTNADIIFNYNPDAHSHSYIGTETTSATCETDGLMTYTCSCGESYTEVITKTGHTPASFTQPVNCAANGYTITTCSVCGKQLDFTVIPSGGHTYGEWTTVNSATCTTKGLEERNCSLCGKDRQTRETDALGHSFSEWKTITPATVMNEGKKERVCSVCKLKETEIIPVIEVTETKDNASGISVSFDDEAYDGKDVVVVAEEEYVGSQYLTQSYDRFDTWNITTYVDGEKAQPDTPVMVKIPLPVGYNPSMIAVFHVNSNNGTVEKIDGIEIRDGYICFMATSFSLYIVVDESSVSEPVPQCNCRCHKTGFSGFLWKILRFFYKLFGRNQVCACGVYHY